MLNKNTFKDYEMEMVDLIHEEKHLERDRKHLGRYEVSTILYIFAGEQEPQLGLYIHDSEDEFHDGDCIIEFEQVDTEQELLDYLQGQEAVSSFSVDENGIFHLA